MVQNDPFKQCRALIIPLSSAADNRWRLPTDLIYITNNLAKIQTCIAFVQPLAGFQPWSAKVVEKPFIQWSDLDVDWYQSV